MNQPIVGNFVEYFNKEKGTTTKYEITGTIPGFLLLKNVETGKGNKLRTDSKIYAEMFGGNPEVKTETEKTTEKPKDAKETVDMSKYIDNGYTESETASVAEPVKTETEKPAPEPKPEPKKESKPKEKPAPAPKKQSAYDRELDVFKVEYTDTDPVIHQVFELNKTGQQIKAFELMIGLITENNAVRKMMTFCLFAWKYRAKFNIDRYSLNEALEKAKRTKSLHDFSIIDFQELCKAILHTVESGDDLDKLVNLLPTEQEYSYLICQMICDGGYTDFGHSLKGLTPWMADKLADRAMAMTEKGL